MSARFRAFVVFCAVLLTVIALYLVQSSADRSSASADSGVGASEGDQ